MNAIRIILAAIHLLIPTLSIVLYGLLQAHSFELASGLEKEAQGQILAKWFNYELMALFVLPPLLSWICLWIFEAFSQVKKHGTFRHYRFRKLWIGLGTWSPFLITFVTWGVAYSIDLALAMISFVVIVPAHLLYGFLVWRALPEFGSRERIGNAAMSLMKSQPPPLPASHVNQKK